MHFGVCAPLLLEKLPLPKKETQKTTWWKTAQHSKYFIRNNGRKDKHKLVVKGKKVLKSNKIIYHRNKTYVYTVQCTVYGKALVKRQ